MQEAFAKLLDDFKGTQSLMKQYELMRSGVDKRGWSSARLEETTVKYAIVVWILLTKL